MTAPPVSGLLLRAAGGAAVRVAPHITAPMATEPGPLTSPARAAPQPYVPASRGPHRP
ncbi:hypothetical protein [Streptomyces sp. 7N604]|uniref:hypothetical protein n=1 Tax=Streptomyces sp. 7N604 TaxID=3457415 RepID=UPI003FD047BA